MKRPLLPSHLDVWFEPPDEAGDEVLHVVSGGRTLRFKGVAFREFYERVVPLLDGTRSLAEVQSATADVFRPEDLEETLGVLADQGVVVDAAFDMPEATRERLRPQLNLFHELAPGQDLQRRLASATVAVIGLGGAGPSVALAVAAAGVGVVRCHDSHRISPSDVYHAPFLGLEAVGRRRAARVAELVALAAPETVVVALEDPVDSEEALRHLLAGVDFAVCCLDEGQLNLILKLNRACLRDGVRWIACAPSGAEITIGPVVDPGKSACYLCYRMRAVAAAGNPENAFAHERYLDRCRSDDSGRRESLVFSAGIAANLVGLEVVKELSGLGEPSLVGRIISIGLRDLVVARHAVLRKPWCPACFPSGGAFDGD